MNEKDVILNRVQANLYTLMQWVEEEQEHSPCEGLKNAIKQAQRVLKASAVAGDDEISPALVKTDVSLKMLADVYNRTSEKMQHQA